MIIGEGKTKRIHRTGKPGEILMETKDELTGGDAAKRERIEGIAAHKTRQAANVFALLNAKGIPTAFIRQEGATGLVCQECDMLPLELVMRRFAWGSCLKRHPEITSTETKPFRFDKVRTELYHKHAVVMPPHVPKPVQMEEGAARERYLKDGAWAAGVYTDPFLRVEGGLWTLHPAKEPVRPDKALLEIAPMMSPADLDHLVGKLMIPVFEALEQAWAGVLTSDGPVALADIKIEAGRRKSDGRLVVADVIDNDSWRIWPGADPRRQLDKQCFRDGHPLTEVAGKYEMVARLTDGFKR